MAKRKHPVITFDTATGLVNQFICAYLVNKSLEMIRNKPSDTVRETLKISNAINNFFTDK